MQNRYLTILELQDMEAAIAHLEKDASFVMTASNPVAISMALSEALQFYHRVDKTNLPEHLGKKPVVQLLLTQLSYLLTGKNVASDEAWNWLYEYENKN